jgi:hypothetical protein
MMNLRTATLAVAMLISVPVLAQDDRYNPEPQAAPGAGTVPGVVGGAAIGGDTGGPVGAVVGGVVGGAAGATLTPPPPAVHNYVVTETRRSVPYRGELAVGQRWPSGIALFAIPTGPRYGYAIVNNERVVVDRRRTSRCEQGCPTLSSGKSSTAIWMARLP